MNRVETFKYIFKNYLIKSIKSVIAEYKIIDINIVELHTWIKFDEIMKKNSSNEIKTIFNKVDKTDIVVFDVKDLNSERIYNIPIDFSEIIFNITNQIYNSNKDVELSSVKEEYMNSIKIYITNKIDAVI